jgi:hypothetical protein
MAPPPHPDSGWRRTDEVATSGCVFARSPFPHTSRQPTEANQHAPMIAIAASRQHRTPAAPTIVCSVAVANPVARPVRPERSPGGDVAGVGSTDHETALLPPPRGAPWTALTDLIYG